MSEPSDILGPSNCARCRRPISPGYVGILGDRRVCRSCFADHIRNAGLRGLAAREAHDPPPAPAGDKRAIEREMHAVTCDLDEDCTCDPVVVSVDPVTTRVRGD